MNLHHLTVGLLHVNCFLLIDPESREAWLIDPGGNANDLLQLVQDAHAHLTRIINTHAHFDHVLAVPDIKATTGATFHLHKAEQPVLDNTPQAVKTWLGWQWGPPPIVDAYLEHGDLLPLGEDTLEVRHVPGHSPGSVIYVDHNGRQVWVGDTLFRGGMGRTDLPGGNRKQLLQAIGEQILTLPDDYILYPGHGPFTTVGEERRTNPFISPDLWVG